MSKTTIQSEILLQKHEGSGILRLTLDDEKRRNALSDAMLAQLGNAIAEASETPDVRVIIISANGPAFCAGHDLKEMASARGETGQGRAKFKHTFAACSRLMLGIVNCPKPVIAEIDGVATAAGCQLVASCDLAIASETSKFSTPGVHIGLFCSTPMVALSRNVANKHAMEMLLTGDMLSASRATEIGLINRSVPQSALSEASMEIARKIASKSGLTLAIGKKAFYEQREMPLLDAYKFASSVMIENMMAQDAEEGINAFIEKRAPEWQDK